MIKKHILDNGLRIVTEEIDYVNSVSVGIWVKVGSINETDKTNGLSHFIEHMLFKGTECRTANQIAEETDRIGGQLDAFTSKDCTCYYIKVLDENLEEALDILTDMFLNSVFKEEEIEKEVDVVVEEIKMYDDSPEDIVHDKISELIFKDSPLAYPILGTEEKLRNYTREDVVNYKNEKYSPNSTVISVAGKFDENKLLGLIKEKFENWQNENDNSIDLSANYERQILGVNKDLEQLHICLANKTLGRHSDMYYPLIVANNIFGGTMSSKLFQEVREKRGLVYTIYSFTSSYNEEGMLGIYAGLAYKNLEKTLFTIIEEMENMKNAKITVEELERAKLQIKSDYLMGLESTSSRMSSMGRRELLYNTIMTPEEVVKKIEAVSMQDVIDISKNILNKENYSVVFTGNLKRNKNIQQTLEKVLYGKSLDKN